MLQLTLLLKGKTRAVWTNVRAMLNHYWGKKAILSHYGVNPKQCRKGFQAHTMDKGCRTECIDSQREKVDELMASTGRGNGAGVE